MSPTRLKKKKLKKMFRLPLLAIIATFALVLSSPAMAQTVTRGFDRNAPADASSEELTNQSNLWVLEVGLKPMRFVRVDVTDPKTGDKKSELVWYLVYRVVNRELDSPPVTPDLAPVNPLDPPPGPILFVPKLTLVTQDGEAPLNYVDEVIPEAEKAIRDREMRGSLKDVPLYNSVSIVRPLPEFVAKGEEPGPDQVLYGVAMWRGVDPDTDYFRILMEGYSNGYELSTTAEGDTQTLRRALVQEYWRPGDRFDELEKEFRYKGEPQWLYLPDEPASADSDDDALGTENIFNFPSNN
ncbi:hypothetical protein [Calycomorphotria hydatis]|uniref:Uncharacterized protein n=1 Tax=Calycomorphotria hydatis TaxID=2528027 RepID=A0A517T7S2_9PLAN|nr:hypothetical protein [Calycomorphotria hydatis]QDT64426.1 hypothetical protein V22_16600 [Calycomorphotria hydatis]